MTRATEAQKWQAWRDAEDRATRMWADPKATAQQKNAACWEAQCAAQQWSDAADETMKARRA